MSSPINEPKYTTILTPICKQEENIGHRGIQVIDFKKDMVDRRYRHIEIANIIAGEIALPIFIGMLLMSSVLLGIVVASPFFLIPGPALIFIGIVLAVEISEGHFELFDNPATLKAIQFGRETQVFKDSSAEGKVKKLHHLLTEIVKEEDIDKNLSIITQGLDAMDKEQFLFVLKRLGLEKFKVIFNERYACQKKDLEPYQDNQDNNDKNKEQMLAILKDEKVSSYLRSHPYCLLSLHKFYKETNEADIKEMCDNIKSSWKLGKEDALSGTDNIQEVQHNAEQGTASPRSKEEFFAILQSPNKNGYSREALSSMFLSFWDELESKDVDLFFQHYEPKPI